MSISVMPFGTSPHGHLIDWITLTNAAGASVSLINYGAHITSVKVPDRQGSLRDVCLGMDSLGEYVSTGKGYMGATVGRYANRIAGASFILNGLEYKLFANNGDNTLHGGKKGFDKRIWSFETASVAGADYVTMRYISPDMEEGFPGQLQVSVTFSWDDDCQLRIDYSAVGDKDTIVNLTNHSYFNLSLDGDIKGHTLQIQGNKVIAIGEDLIPTGDMVPVDNTPYDLREPRLLGDVLTRRDSPMFMAARGFDIGYVLPGQGLREVARLHDPKSGRLMRVQTDQPGIQCYSGQGLDCQGRGGIHYGSYAGIALETQQHPDTVHQPNFGDTTLRVGRIYKTTTVYAFSIA